MSSSDIFAEPMIDTDEYLEEYKEQLMKLDKSGHLPDLKMSLNYKVYSFQGSSFGAHRSIVLTTNDRHFVSVELGFTTVNGKKHIYPVTRAVDKSAKSEMEYLGEIKTTGNHLISNAVAVMKRFGGYFKLGNNCQDYCNYYLQAIGMREAKSMTTGDKTAISGLAAGIVAVLFAVMRG